MHATRPETVSSSPTTATRQEVAWEGLPLCESIARIREPLRIVRDPADGRRGVVAPGRDVAGLETLGELPPLYPEWLGDRSFAEAHGTRFPYVSGAMANGIATTRIVVEMGRAGFLGFFGSAGLPLPRVEEALSELRRELGDDAPWGCNLIHSPQEPAVEGAVVDLLLREGVRNVSAAAFMSMTPSLVRCAVRGLRRGPDGQVLRARHVFAKVSRPEVARRFLEPAPKEILDRLVRDGGITADEARLAAEVPVAEDLTVESDSGGHTDNRPLTALFASLQCLRDRIVAERGYRSPVRLGAAGGIGTPTAVAAAFSLGASYVLTGSVNQACIESGLDAAGRAMLADAGLADVIMAPAADMFEMGVEVQVLRRGTMFAVRGRKLYDLYRTHDSLESIPAAERKRIETDVLRATFEEAWESTRAFWANRDPREVEKAERDPKHRMALVFRSYLGQASRWAIAGVADRRTDFQIWCGPAMGAFNAWCEGSFLADPRERRVVQVARNLMEGAAVVTRAQQLRGFGLAVPAAAFDFRPRPLG